MGRCPGRSYHSGEFCFGIATLQPDAIPGELVWNRRGGGTIASYDIFVAENYGPFVPWLQNMTEVGALFQGTNAQRYEFYSVATDNFGNREPAPLYADTQTIIALSNNAPTLSLNAPAIVDEGSNVVITASVTDLDLPGQSLLFTLPTAPAGASINPSTGRVQWPTGEGNGPSTNLFVIIVRDNGLPPLYATNSVTVAVREVNQAPLLNVLTNFVISEGQCSNTPTPQSTSICPHKH